MTKVGEIIERGARIPDDVLEFEDTCKDSAGRNEDGTWWTRYADPDDGLRNASESWAEVLPFLAWPLTVTAVREPDPAQEVGMIADDCSWCKAHGYTLGQQLTHEGVPIPAAPLVLSLPQVPAGTIALIGDKTGTRYEPRGDAWRPVTSSFWHQLGEVLQGEGSVTVVMREPRTWPALPGDPEGVTSVRGNSGRVYRPIGRQWVSDDVLAACDSFPSLQNFDGPLTEVFEDEPGGGR